MIISKIATRAGHSLDVGGAVGIVKEVTEDRNITREAVTAMRAYGINVLDVTPTYSGTSAVDLTTAVKKAVAWGAQFFMSIHLNAFDKASHGVEVIYDSAESKVIAERIMANIVALGFSARTVYTDRRGLYEFKATPNLNNIIVECFFVDNTGDVDLYRNVGARAIGQAIANAIAGQTVKVAENAPTVNTGVSSSLDANVLKTQRAMNKLGFDDANGKSLAEDGKAGNCTKQAVKDFQLKMRVSADGIAGNETWGAINQILAKPLCRVGCDKVYAVRYLQYRFGLAMDGIFGEQTKGQVMQFQHDCKLIEDGICGNDTWFHLIG